MSYLTKSRFKLACECETKLFYYRNAEYADQSGDDTRCGERNMVDMWDLVAHYYYSPHAEGSTSLKRILPMAYAKLQFFNTPEDQRSAIRDSLYKYCELDTLAMVMLWEFWNDEINN